MKLLLSLIAILLATNTLDAQAPGVPSIDERHGDNPKTVAAAEQLIAGGELLRDDQVMDQLKRSRTKLSLPEPSGQALEGRELFAIARAAHLQVGWFYKCTRCDRWHFNLAGGYAVTAGGAVATCFHVVEPGDTIKEGFLIAVTADGEVLPVTEVLAADKLTDACIVKVRPNKPLEPIALQSELHPGDNVWCYSDPAGKEGYFSRGMVNRFFRHLHGSNDAPLRINVSTDWAPGSSGSAVIDAFGNAVGHVTTIDAHGSGGGSDGGAKDDKTLIVFHSAVRAMDVQALIDESN